MRQVSVAAHLLAVLAMGVMAGFFFAYSANVNLATAAFDGPTYALAQSAFNRNVRHPLFFAAFFGPTLLAVGALAAGWRERRSAWWWLVLAAGLLYTFGIVVYTRFVNLPLNALTESWTPATLPADWTSTRDAWNAANLWRTLASFACFAVAAAGLLLRRR